MAFTKLTLLVVLTFGSISAEDCSWDPIDASEKNLWIECEAAEIDVRFLGNNSALQLLKIHTGLQSIANYTFRSASGLKVLDLSHNEIAVVEVEAFSGLAKLEQLELSNNQIKELNQGIFNEMLNLKKLHLNDNQLKVFNFTNLQKNQNLTEIYLQNNEIASFGSVDPFFTFPRLAALEVVNIADNPFPKMSYLLMRLVWRKLRVFKFGGNLTECCQLNELFPNATLQQDSAQKPYGCVHIMLETYTCQSIMANESNYNPKEWLKQQRIVIAKKTIEISEMEEKAKRLKETTEERERLTLKMKDLNAQQDLLDQWSDQIERQKEFNRVIMKTLDKIRPVSSSGVEQRSSSSHIFASACALFLAVVCAVAFWMYHTKPAR